MPAAAVIPAVIGAGAATAGAAIQAHAAGNASEAQQRSQEQALGLQRQIYQDQLARTQPYVNAGTQALGGLMSHYGPGGQSFDQRIASTLAPFQGAVGMQGLNAGLSAYGQPPSMPPVPTSAAGPMVWMRSPTGDVQQVRSQDVAHFEAKGAKRLEGL